MGVLDASYRKAGAQFYYGVDNDPLGFPGLVASYDAANMTVDAEGTTALASVGFVKFGERDVQFVFGENTVLKLGEWRVESLEDENGKKIPRLRRRHDDVDRPASREPPQRRAHQEPPH